MLLLLNLFVTIVTVVLKLLIESETSPRTLAIVGNIRPMFSFPICQGMVVVFFNFLFIFQAVEIQIDKHTLKVE